MMSNPYPLMAYALWVEPDREAQERMLGGVECEGQSLFSYVMMFNRMDEGLRSRWREATSAARHGEPGSWEALRRLLEAEGAAGGAVGGSRAF